MDLGTAGGGPRDNALRIGALDPDPANMISDVAAAAVGHVTVVRDEPPPAGVSLVSARRTGEGSSR